jgi:hypothetical protein
MVALPFIGGPMPPIMSGPGSKHDGSVPVDDDDGHPPPIGSVFTLMFMLFMFMAFMAMWEGS